MGGPRFYNEPPQEIIHLYDERDDGCWYPIPSSPDSRQLSDFELTESLNWENVQKSDQIAGLINDNRIMEADEMIEGLAENPKQVQAMKDGKAPMDRIPLGPLAAVARVMYGGGEKYGIRNFLLDKIRASTYVGAIFRHFIEWALGAKKDKESGEHPLAHVIACCLIVMDSEEHGTLIDDRLIQESIDPDTREKRTHNPLADDRSSSNE